jgi:hypothetical protein
MLEAAAEVDVAALVAQRHLHQAAVAAHLAAQLQAFHRGRGGARREPAAGVEAQRQLGCIG